MEISVLSQDLEFATSLADGVQSDLASKLSIVSASRVPGHADTVALIIAQLESLPANVAGSLIAAWLWQAFHRSGSTSKARVTIRTERMELEIEVEGVGEEALAQILIEAIDRVDIS